MPSAALLPLTRHSGEDRLRPEHRDRLLAGKINGGHDDADRDELQDNAPAHQGLAQIGAAAAQHVPQADQQHEGDSGER